MDMCVCVFVCVCVCVCLYHCCKNQTSFDSQCNPHNHNLHPQYRFNVRIRLVQVETSQSCSKNIQGQNLCRNNGNADRFSACFFTSTRQIVKYFNRLYLSYHLFIFPTLSPSFSSLFLSFFLIFNGSHLNCDKCLIFFPGTTCFPECRNNWGQELDTYRSKWYVMYLYASKWFQMQLKTFMTVKQLTYQSSRQWQNQWRNIN